MFFVQNMASSHYYVFEFVHSLNFCCSFLTIFVVVVATNFVWFVSAWKRGGDAWNFFLFGAWHHYNKRCRCTLSDFTGF
jgi:hypothetical protein